MKKSVRYAALLSSFIAGTYSVSVSANVYAADTVVAANAGVQSEKKRDHKQVDKAGKSVTGSTVSSSPSTPVQAANAAQPVVQITPKAADKPLPEQWYTGSLYSPSPALPTPGMIAVEPYIAAGLPAGAFDSNGRLDKRVGSQHSISQFTLAKYGITKHLSIYLLPQYSYSWGNKKKPSGLKFNDLPIEFQYRLTPHYTPSFTLYLGVNAPTGDYSNLANASEGVGQGVWAIRYGVHSQFALPFFNHAMRIRLWAQARQPVTSARLRNITAYGTDRGFTGRGHQGPYGNEGGSIELGFTKKWVFAMDLYHSWSSSASAHGYNYVTGQRVDTRTGWSGAMFVGPGIEYNWTANIGGIIGAVLPVVGHNTTRSISPQVAVFAVF